MIEQLIAFGAIMIGLGIIFALSDFVYRKWVEKPEYEEFNKKQFDAMNDEHFGDML